MMCEICDGAALEDSRYCPDHYSINLLKFEIEDIKNKMKVISKNKYFDDSEKIHYICQNQLHLERLDDNLILMLNEKAYVSQTLDKLDNDKSSPCYRRIDPNIRDHILQYLF